MEKKFLILWLIIGLKANIYAQHFHACYPKDPRWGPRERYIDMHHLKLEIDPEPITGLVKGTATITFSPLKREIDSIWLDAIRFDIQQVQLNGSPVSFVNLDSGIAIYPDKIHREKANLLEIKYAVYPQKGIYFTGWDDPAQRARKQMWTQGQGIDHRHWIPYYDEQHDKLTTEVVVHFDRNFQVISNGRLLAADTLRDKIRWHYLQDKPHPGYLIMIAAGKYVPVRSTLSFNGRNTEFEEYIYPELAHAGESTYRHSMLFMQKFEELLKVPYPWPGPYRQVPVVDFIYGAMENTGAVIFGEMFLSDTNTESYRNYHFVNAHEMAHQWFGNLITAWSARHHWLHESFATYFDLLSNRWTDGDFVFSSKVRQAIDRVRFQESENNLPLAHSEAGTARHYQKGAVVLHMLRQLVGDEAFYESLRVFLERFKFRNAHSDDLLYAFHEVTGRDLQWFWDQWVYGSGMPRMKLNWSEISDKQSKKLLVIFEQQNVHPADSSRSFRFRFDVEIKTDKKHFIIPVEINSKIDTFYIPVLADETVLMVNPDPGKIQLIDWVEIQDNNRNISQYAEYAFDRYFAYSIDKKTFRIGDLDFVKNEKESSVLTHWIDAFGKNCTRPELWNFFVQFDDDPVRLALVRQTDVNFWKSRTESELLRFVQSNSPLLRALAYSRLINTRPDQIEMYKKNVVLYNAITTQSERFMMAVAEANLLKSPESYEAIAHFAGGEYTASVRSQAINYLMRAEYVSEELIRLCVYALGHYDRGLPVSAATFLKKVNDKKQKKLIENELKKYQKIWPDWKIKRARSLIAS